MHWMSRLQSTGRLTPTRLTVGRLTLISMVVAGSALLAAAAPGDDKVKGKEPEVPQLPGIHVDRKNKVVDVEGKIILPLNADWLELLACAPKSREHESIVRIEAKPSHIHGALLLIGLKPGAPGRAERVGCAWVYHAPKGAAVAVTIVYEKDGKQVEVAANEWIIEQKTKAKLPDNVWLFTGSTIYEVDGKGVYLADIEGNILSLVNFGNEVLARKTARRGGQEGGNTWGANAKEIPPIGTKVLVRLKAAKEEGKGDEKGEK